MKEKRWKNYDWQHRKDGKIVKAGQFKAKSLEQAKKFALNDSGLKQERVWRFNIWYDTGYGSIEFCHYGGNNWKYRMELNQECLIVCEDTETAKRVMFGIEDTSQPTQLELIL